MEIFQRQMPLIEDNPNNLLMHVNRHLERIHAMSSLTIDDLKQAIMNDPVLFNALKGVSGDTIQNYGGSLLKNGAFELGTKDNWNNQSSIELSQEDGKNIATVTGQVALQNLSLVNINSERLYKISFSYKNGTGVIPIIVCLRANSQVAVTSPLDTQTYLTALPHYCTT